MLFFFFFLIRSHFDWYQRLNFNIIFLLVDKPIFIYSLTHTHTHTPNQSHFQIVIAFFDCKLNHVGLGLIKEICISAKWMRSWLIYSDTPASHWSAKHRHRCKNGSLRLSSPTMHPSKQPKKKINKYTKQTNDFSFHLSFLICAKNKQSFFFIPNQIIPTSHFKLQFFLFFFGWSVGWQIV